MSKGKLQKFADLESYSNVFQFPFSVMEHVAFDMKGKWREMYFHNDNPIVLELGCGKGEYTVALARLFPEVNFIGVDIKGARLWSGATEALRDGLTNVAFLRTNIEIIDRFFDFNEVQEIWLTFSDPQMKNPRKRLTSSFFMERYRRFLTPGGTVHLKTDSAFLYQYTLIMAQHNSLPLLFHTDDLYHCPEIDEDTRRILEIKTYYEQQWIERGLSIKYLKLSLTHDTPLTESEIEIELDDYRSYKRFSRSPVAKRV